MEITHYIYRLNSYFIFIPFTACKAQKKCDELFNLAFTNTANKNVSYKIHTMGKDAIPCLIDFIDINIKTSIGFKDPSSSDLSSFIFHNYLGIRAAYLIEFIISKDSIETVKSDEWVQKIKPYRIYEYGVIINKTKNNKPIPEPLEFEDMKALKEIYLKWWKLNKEKPIEQLRKEWRENKHILEHSNYKWI